jgi:hypothetical protein
MTEFDYNAAAEVFLTAKTATWASAVRVRSDLRKPHGPSVSLRRACRQNELSARFAEIDEQRYCGDDICRLYESAEYPLTRHGARS